MENEKQQSTQTSLQQKKLWYKQPWVIVVGLIILLAIITRNSASLLMLLMLVSLICFLISWISPRIFYKLFGKESKALIRTIFGLAMFIFFVTFGIIPRGSESNKKYSEEEVKDISQDNAQPENGENKEEVKEEGQSQVAGKESTVEYEIIKTEDQSRKATGNKKMRYKIVVSSDGKDSNIEATIEKIISDITLGDNDIDEISLLLYSNNKLIEDGFGFDIASATWAPLGKLGNVTAEIAKSNNRDNYEISSNIIQKNLKESLSQNKETESLSIFPSREKALGIIKENAQKAWGDNYRMIKYKIDEQIEAYDWLVKQKGYPQIMEKAYEKWGNDYWWVRSEYKEQIMQDEYKKQVEAYESL